MQEAYLLLDFGMRSIAEGRVPRTPAVTNHIPTGFLYGEFFGGLTGILGTVRTVTMRFLCRFPAGAEKLFSRCLI